MGDIHILDERTIDRIAAGEVVERPASVIKELVENAVDAGASRVTVEIRDGGISLIRVTDNGRGIAPEDVPLAFLRHATSKITDAGDLRTLQSLGFRGEALSSIAAVSRVELITKRPEELSALRYLIEGGREKLSEEIGAPDGTTIIVRDLFYNTPARAKFLKTPMTEAAHAGAVIEQLLLSNPGVSFTWIVNGQTKLASPGNGNLRDTIFNVYGKEIASRMTEISRTEPGIRIEGWIGKPAISRGNRNYENYYVNGRYVKSKIIARGIEDGYGTKLMQHQYPFSCFMITLDTDAVDVNVHPTKMEVRFSDEKLVYGAVREAVESALRGLAMVVESPGTENGRTGETSGRGADSRKKTVALQAFETGASGTARREVSAPPETPVRKEAEHARERLTDALMEEQADYGGRDLVRDEVYSAGSGRGRFVQQTFSPEFVSAEAKPMRRLVGQVFSTYWICEYGGSVYLFDQHAAHEKVLFEKFMEAYEKREIMSQTLEPPMLVSLDMREQDLMETYMDAFTALGFEIEPFGDRDYAVRAVPYSLGTISSEKLFLELLDQLEVTPSLRDMKLYVLKVATEACKAAVKGGETLSFAEAEALLDELMKCEDPYHCPHGRPTIISFTEKDLEKLFKRIV